MQKMYSDCSGSGIDCKLVPPLPWLISLSLKLVKLFAFKLQPQIMLADKLGI
jgi:hypothetical protein